MNSNLVVIYEGEQPILEWFTKQIPPFKVNEILWLEVTIYPAWRYEPEPMELTEFKIISISHSILRTCTDKVDTFYKMEVMVKPVG